MNKFLLALIIAFWVAIAALSIYMWVAIATSDLPLWMKFMILK